MPKKRIPKIVVEWKAFEKRIEKQVKSTRADNLSAFRLIDESLKAHTEILNEVRKVSSGTEETLLNVLHAIRQNEYLQAWSPPQNGYPALKVVGTHPSNLDAK
jgi:hypothetical protein